VRSFLGSGMLSRTNAVRCINVVNFIRAVEPRFQTDLILPVQKQMELVLEHKLPATWLLQFDALVSGPFVAFLKDHIAANHEVGTWFEMNEMHCKTAGVEWRGRPGYEWDSHPPVAFTIGYTEGERIKLADTVMREFKSAWGKYPSSVASWNLDSITMGHLTEHYGIDAFAVCRDQIATDGFTIWGAPIAGYYPSKTNCWSPALSRHNQISAPVFRMLAQDPVYYYDRGYKLPDGRQVGEPDTMEPVWTSGRSDLFVKQFLGMISDSPALEFAYAQLGQENSFSWPDMAAAYSRQMRALAQLRDTGKVHVETMGDSGRRFKHSFPTTPVQAQVQLDDPFGNTDPAEGSIWYQSRFYRVNLHIKGDLPYLRDVTVYSDRFPQPFLTEATRLSEVDQRMPAILDGYHWRKDTHSSKDPGSGGFFEADGERLRLVGRPEISELGKTLRAELPIQGGRTMVISFEEERIVFQLTPQASLNLSFEWNSSKAALTGVHSQRIDFRWQGFDYHMIVRRGAASSTLSGYAIAGSTGAIELQIAQPS